MPLVRRSQGLHPTMLANGSTIMGTRRVAGDPLRPRFFEISLEIKGQIFSRCNCAPL